MQGRGRDLYRRRDGRRRERGPPRRLAAISPLPHQIVEGGRAEELEAYQLQRARLNRSGGRQPPPFLCPARRPETAATSGHAKRIRLLFILFQLDLTQIGRRATLNRDHF